MNTLTQRPPLPGTPVRVVIAKPGLDGHDRGAKVIARALRDAGHEVIYTGLHQTPAQIVACAIQEDASVVGLSVLSGAHLTATQDVITLLAEQGAADVRVIVGGIIPAADIPVLRAMGVQAVFTPGADLTSIVEMVGRAAAGTAEGAGTAGKGAGMTIAKVLIANRGEIAVRVARACRDAGLASVAVYADPDRDAPHVRAADEAFALGGDTPAASYLDAGKILAAAAKSGADAVHPGYGFLSENADFAQAVLDAGLTWIGPPPQAIRDLGDKVAARKIAQRAGAPLVPGTADPVAGAAEVIAFAEAHGLPVAIKAAFGGGGRGLKVARTLEEIPELYESAVREAVGAFGRGECFVERYLDRPRHVETQCLADTHGTVVVVSTRDCSLQRRHQKLVEEAPAPYLTEHQEAVLRAASKAILREAGYVGAGTCEFLVGQDGTISFLEVNTRLQVEHPVTEEVTGIDLVREMFRIADGEPLGRGRTAAPATRARAATRSSSASTPRTRAAASCPGPAPSPPGGRPPGPASASTRASRRAR